MAGRPYAPQMRTSDAYPGGLGCRDPRGSSGSRLRPARPRSTRGAPKMSEQDTEVRHHPAVVAHRENRAGDVQLRVADAITKFAGSMPFVYIHAVVFALWMLFLEGSPWPTLTLVVSLEAIFLSTFVMIGQNRQA